MSLLHDEILYVKAFQSARLVNTSTLLHVLVLTEVMSSILLH